MDVYSSTRVYIAKVPAHRQNFVKHFAMMNEARGSRTSNTDFSIARILADDRRCHAGASAASLDNSSEVPGKRRKRECDCEHVSPETDNDRYQVSRISGGDGETRDDVDHVDVEETGGEELGRNASPIQATRRRPPSGEEGGDDGTTVIRRTDLTWLQYTRYRPPKLPRKSAINKRARRRTGQHPRIPFSSSQLQVLEERYRRNAYLTRSDVVEISETLRLPQNKVRQVDHEFSNLIGVQVSFLTGDR